MFVMTLWAAILNQINFGASNNVLLQIINVIIILSMIWVAGEGLVKLFVTKIGMHDGPSPVNEPV